jgi:hemerythrin-like metal-binding protein
MTPESFVHYMVGVPDIDATHWELIREMRIVIDLYQSKDVTRADEALLVLAEDLADHHREEELFMESIGYPYRVAHKKAHAEQYALMCDIVQQSKDGIKVSYVVERLKRHFATHLDDQDMQYAQWLKVNNLIDKVA